MRSLKDAVFEREDIVLLNDVVNSLGPNLVLKKCKLTLQCSRQSLIVAGLEMVDSEFDARKKLMNFSFERALFTGVSFRGSYSGCDFGAWEKTGLAEVSDCNFRDAKLDGCRFINCDVRKITFPSWPHFTILEPHKRVQAIAHLDWPSDLLGKIIKSSVDQDPRCAAITRDATQVTKANGGSPNELKQLLSKVDGILL